METEKQERALRYEGAHMANHSTAQPTTLKPTERPIPGDKRTPEFYRHLCEQDRSIVLNPPPYDALLNLMIDIANLRILDPSTDRTALVASYVSQGMQCLVDILNEEFPIVAAPIATEELTDEEAAQKDS